MAFSDGKMRTYQNLLKLLNSHSDFFGVLELVKIKVILATLLSNGVLGKDRATFISAFTWNETEQGFDFWKRVHNICVKSVDPVVEDNREIV